jgi:hypothetical protein
VSASLDDHPIRLVVTDDLERSRLTVLLRLLLAIPHLVVVYVWAILAAVAVVIAWVAGVFLGRIPDGLHTFLASFVRYTTRVRAYVGILANPFPTFGSGGSYPVDAEIAPPTEQNRLTIFVRLLLAIPALILGYVFQIGLNIVAVFGWFASLALGRMPGGLENLGVYCLRWETQTWAYVFLLTSRYPSLSGIG